MYVIDQLISSGTFAYYKLMRHGYPLRIDFQIIHQKYEPYFEMDIDAKILLKLLMSIFGDSEYRFGISHVMMRSSKVFKELVNFDEANIQKNVQMMKRKLAARSKWTLIFTAAKFLRGIFS